MSPELVRKIYADVSEVMRDGPARDRLLASGNELVLNPPQQFGEYLRTEVKRWGEVIKAANIRAE
jgi:tripartite-type tricarboxylate transporter receptor subunit TctC